MESVPEPSIGLTNPDDVPPVDLEAPEDEFRNNYESVFVTATAYLMTGWNSCFNRLEFRRCSCNVIFLLTASGDVIPMWLPVSSGSG